MMLDMLFEISTSGNILVRVNGHNNVDIAMTDFETVAHAVFNDSPRIISSYQSSDIAALKTSYIELDIISEYLDGKISINDVDCEQFADFGITKEVLEAARML